MGGGSDGRGQPGGGGQVLVGEAQVLDHHRHLPPHHRRHHHRHRLHRLRRTEHHLTLGLSCQRPVPRNASFSHHSSVLSASRIYSIYLPVPLGVASMCLKCVSEG